VGEQRASPCRGHPAPLVVAGPVGQHRGHRGSSLRQPQRDALTGQRVHVSARVAHEQHPTGRPPPAALPQRSGALHRGQRLGAGQPLDQRAELGKVLAKRASAAAEYRHSHDVAPDRRDVGLRLRPPEDVDVARPRRDLEVLAKPVPARATGGAVQPELSAGPRVQSVGGDDVAGALRRSARPTREPGRHLHAVVVLTQTGDRHGQDRHPGRVGGRREPGVQLRAPDPPAGSVGEVRDGAPGR
jgi:hypothetical protein